MTSRKSKARHRRAPRRGAALLVCLFIVFMVSSLVLNLLDTEVFQFAATRNTIEYEQSLYWANAGVHAACAELAQDTTWRGTLQDGALPPTSPAQGYEVTATDNGLGGVTVVATGYAGAGHRTVEANIDI